MPGQELTDRIGKQWQEIGFQGNNPATDFRGMGLLGLQCLLYPGHLALDMASWLCRGRAGRAGLGLAVQG